MGNILIVLIILVLLFFGARRIYRTIRYGGSCCGTGEGMEKKVLVKDRHKANYPFHYRLKVEGMVCAGCARKVENAINSDGMLWAKADLEHKEVHVRAKKEMSRDDFMDLLKGTPYTLLDVE